ncbi:MAG: sigma-70 family RNA polymerase sigma factor [Planctomycetes bacterium]|nr:sigma-70 family RNA polymerase sigma factor [Planctomycetota bacterium]MBU4398283.1 sigma-70 family RNA polymerase sigma factor [Planctomycetota bacterium]MCG2684755.1 sigma-70 family RNA polymerase sigma factor [Planctomycetales bacterium]
MKIRLKAPFVCENRVLFDSSGCGTNALPGLEWYWLMNEQEHHNLFSELIARHQSELYAYIFAIVRNWEDTDDLFQSVCLVLWRKIASFQRDSSFFSWARQTAKLEVRNFLRRKRLPGYVSEKVLDALAETTIDAQSDDAELYLAALRRCKVKLTVADEELLELCYVEDLGSRQIADRLHRPQPSVCNSLKRIRRWLLECIQMELTRQEHSGEEHSYE